MIDPERKQEKTKKFSFTVCIILLICLGFAWQQYNRWRFKRIAAEVETQLAPLGTRMSAPDFTLKDLNNKLVSLNDYKGAVVFLGFWTTW